MWLRSLTIFGGPRLPDRLQDGEWPEGQGFATARAKLDYSLLASWQLYFQLKPWEASLSTDAKL